LIACATSVTMSVLLTGCSSDSGQSLARQACGHVEESISLYHQAEKTPSKRVARQKVVQAAEQLTLALPLAARANSENGQWNALMTTISESSRVSESGLISALAAQCVVADSSNGADQGPLPTNPPKSP
jgi:hypothetical protein